MTLNQIQAPQAGAPKEAAPAPVCRSPRLKKQSEFPLKDMALCPLPPDDPATLRRAFDAAPQFRAMKTDELLATARRGMRVVLRADSRFYAIQAAAYLTALSGGDQPRKPQPIADEDGFLWDDDSLMELLDENPKESMERASGLSFNTYMRENVFSPLGINAAYAAHLLPDPTPLSHTYTMNGEVYMKAEHYLENDRNGYDDTCDPDAHYHASAGSLYISLSGLEKIGAMLACGGKTGGVRVLSPTAAAEMRADQARVPGSSVTGDSPYGLNMYRYTAEDGLCWYGHQGRWQGLLVDLFVEPGSGTAVVFVMNGVGRSGAGEMDAKAARALARVGQWLREQADTEGSFVVEDDEEF